MGGYYLGYYISMLNDAGLPYAQKVLGYSNENDAKFVVSVSNFLFGIGAMISVFMIGPVAKHIGLMKVLILCEVLGLACCGWYCIPNVWSFYGCRTVSGMIAGFN